MININLLAKYSDSIIKEIMSEVMRAQRKLDKARNREIELHLQSNEHKDNYWKTQRTIEVQFAYIDKLYEELKVLDSETQWESKLHQERFGFIQQKYAGILEEYQFRYERLEGANE